ncbi:MAG: hypothetical protein ACI86H_002722 [bacterium]|jgi:hypothetical protein
MKVPVENFTHEEKTWYANLMVQAALEDRRVDPTEIEFLIKVCYFLDDEGKDEVRRMLRSKEKPKNVFTTIPESFRPTALATIYTEMTLFLISNALAMSSTEKKFMLDLGAAFQFDDKYIESVLEWGDVALKQNKDRKSLVERIQSDEKRGRVISHTKA